MSRTKIVLACIFLCSALVMTAAAGNDTSYSDNIDLIPLLAYRAMVKVYDDSNTVLSNIMTKPDLYGMCVLWIGDQRRTRRYRYYF